ncbi:MAG: copper chaperone PCu(A)C [Lysobacterales bacterium]
MLKFFRLLAGSLVVRVFASVACWGAAGPAAADPQLAFDAAWVRALPPGMHMTAGFGTISNPGNEAIELTAFSSPQFADVSLHRSETVDGVSRMREVPALRVEAGASVELKPGGYHLMLMKPAAPLQAGQAVNLILTAADGREFRFEVPVERR